MKQEMIEKYFVNPGFPCHDIHMVYQLITMETESVVSSNTPSLSLADGDSEC
jgi:hypothetical protein